MTIGGYYSRTLDIHDIGPKEGRKKVVEDLLDAVGLNPDHAAFIHMNFPVVNDKE